MHSLSLWVFWSALAALLYTYAGYPLFLAVLAALRPRPVARASEDAADDDWPQVTVVIVAHNEAGVLRSKLRNVLAWDYPRQQLAVLVISDASTDDTDTIASSFANSGVRLLRQDKRKGKTHAQNLATANVQGDVVVCTDASIMAEPIAVKSLVQPIRDDAGVGVVSGRLVGHETAISHEARGERWYLGYEMLVRRLESMTGSTVGAAGALYAVRRELFRPYPDHLSRDFGSVLMATEAGMRAIVAAEAVCYVESTWSLSAEYRRKLRTMSRGLQTFLYHRKLLNPVQHGLFAVKLLSHKLARWLLPFFVLALLGSAVLLSASPGYRLVAVGLGIALALSSVAALVTGLLGVGGPIARLAYFAIAHIAAGEAWYHVLSGNRNPLWLPTRRNSASRTN